MSNPIAQLLQKMVLDFHKENDVHPFGVIQDNIKSMFREFEQKQEEALTAFQNEILNYIDEQATKIREDGCDYCETLTPHDENDLCLFCHQKRDW